MDQEARKHFLARMFGQKEQPSAATEATHQSAVLVVDDSRTVTIALQRILESAGYLTVAAFDGAQAVEMAERYRPDLILMDIVMPRMNGFEATRAILAKPDTRYTPIIIVSGNDQPSDRIWGTRIGAKGFLSKPINKSELLKTIQTTLLMARRDQALRERGVSPGAPVIPSLDKNF